MASVKVIPYQVSWAEDFLLHKGNLKDKLKDQVLRIDHIGSTSVRGLAAKDIIDIQIAVKDLSETFVKTMTKLGYRYHPALKDNLPINADPNDWQKQVFSEPQAIRRLNIHVRRFGAANMRQALLFRDYLRAHPKTTEAHGLLKMRLAEKHPNNRNYYYAIKDPIFEIIWEAAQHWAETNNWTFETYLQKKK